MKIKQVINRNKLKKFYRDISNVTIDLFLIIFQLFKKSINQKPFVIVTGADSSHFNSLVNLLKSINLYEKGTETNVYNLGMSIDEINYLKSNFKFNFIDFDFKSYPPFIGQIDNSNKLGSYAWKAIIVFNEYKNNKNILWLDAGCIVTKELRLLKKLILKNGFFSPESSNRIKDWTHPNTISKLNFPVDNLTKRNFSSGLVGLAADDKKIKRLVKAWYKHSLDRETIAPNGSSRENHRQDQSILTLLVHLESLDKTTLRTHKMFGLLKHQDNENINHLSSNKNIKFNF